METKEQKDAREARERGNATENAKNQTLSAGKNVAPGLDNPAGGLLPATGPRDSTQDVQNKSNISHGGNPGGNPKGPATSGNLAIAGNAGNFGNLAGNIPAAGAQETKPAPHQIVVADGIRGSDDEPARQQNQQFPLGKQKETLAVSEGAVRRENEVVAELAKMHDEIERLTKEYTEGGLQVSDFPASYHVLTNNYRIRAAALNRGVGGVGPEEAKALKEIEALRIQMESKLAAARALDTRNAEERRTHHQGKGV